MIKPEDIPPELTGMVERPLPAKPNRAKRREERKRERQARKRGRR